MYEEEEMMNEKKLIIDDETSRKYIVENIDKNYFVEASAGSGKTFSLVLRMVAMIESGIPVNKICTITFTKAAANEFFSRFQNMLSIRSVNASHNIDKFFKAKNEETMNRCRVALENIDLCFLGTIDSFGNMIAHELPNQLDLPSDAEVISKDEQKKLIKEKYEEILKDRTHPYHLKALAVNELFYKPRDAYVKVMDSLSNLRHLEIIFDKDLANVDLDIYFSKKEKDEFLTYVKGLCSKDMAFNPKQNGGRSDLYKKTSAIINNYWHINKDHWTNRDINLINFILRQIKDIDGKISKNVLDTDVDFKYHLVEPLPEGSRKRSLEFSSEAKECFNNIKNKIDNYMFSVLFDFASSILKDLFDELKEQGKMGFFDFLYYLTKAFKESALTDRILVDHILERHSHFLLDESQDTDPLQTEMFFYLTGTVKDSDWTKMEPREGSLFIVGDPKQSIYRFRNADVSAFNKTKAIFAEKDRVLILTKNFRSREIIKEWLNESMNNILDHGVEAISHPDIPINEEVKAKEAEPFLYNGEKVTLYQGVYKYYIENKDDPEAVAKFITEMVNNPNKIILKKDKKTGKTIKDMISYGDIRVVPRKADVSDYIAAFTKYNIPMVIEADIPFNQSQTIIALRDIVYLLKDPSNISNLLNVLYSDLYKLDDFDIIQMKKNGFSLDISNLNNKKGELVNFADEKVGQIINDLHDLYLETLNMSYSSTMLYVLNNKKLDLYSKIDSTYLEYTFFLLEKIKEREESGLIAGLSQFKEYVDSFLNADTDDNRTLRFRKDLDRVILANLHKVKGLQAPIVLLVGPNKKKREETRNVYYQKETPCVMFSSLEGEGFNNVLTSRHDIDENEINLWNEYSQAEKERIEYVGATRAESVLIVAKNTKLNSDCEDPWSDITDNIDDSQVIPVPEVEPVGSESVSIPLNDSIANDKCNTQSINYLSPSRMVKDYKVTSFDNNNDDINEDIDNSDSTLIGTIVHRFMECVVSSKKSNLENQDLINEIIEEYHSYEYKNLLMEVAKTIFNGGYTQKNGTADNDILKLTLNAEEAFCEMPFSYRKGNNVINGIVDLIYKDKNGYHIIDYKTNREDDVSILEKEYESQLNDYINALKEVGINADAHIYHISVK